MLPYFPFDDDMFAMTMGVQPLGERSLIEIDLARYHEEVAQKAAILSGDQRYYVQALPGTELMQWEALALTLHDLARHQPALFRLNIQGDRWSWSNALLDTHTQFRFGDAATLPVAPLDWAGRQVQEDLLLLAGEEAAGFPLVAGQLCFANMWSLDEKIGKSFAAIHAPVPLFAERVGRSSHLLMARLKADRPVWRLNWSIVSNDWLNLASRFAEENHRTKQAVTAKNAGERCFLRIERQGLARLPQSNAVLFTIHTYRSPIAAETRDPERARRTLGVLQTAPATTLAYKGIAPFAKTLCEYLEEKYEV